MSSGKEKGNGVKSQIREDDSIIQDDDLSIRGDSQSTTATTSTLKSKWRRFIEFIEIEEPGDLTTSQMYLFNYDIKPVEQERRQWAWYNYVTYWIADSFNINTFQIAATGVQNGMNWWQTWVSVWIGYFFCGIFVSIGARVGLVYKIAFPVSNRSAFGNIGSIWPVINRVVMSCIWYSVQSYVAAPTIQLMIRSVFGNDMEKKIPNHISDPDLTTFKFLSFFLFWLLQLPFIYVSPHKIRHLFTVKAFIAPLAGVLFLAWTLAKCGGAGPVIHAKATIQGSELGWVFVESVMSSLANFATLIVNAPDFARFASKPSFSMKYIVYTVSIPICFSVTALIGILIGSASTVLYGAPTWSPLDVLSNFLDNDYSSASRAGVFFISASFALAQLGTNISANSLSFGTDVTALLPRFLNIRRGGYICALLALAICPWKLASSSSKFTTYLSAYAVFLSSIAGVVASDYFYVRRGYLKLTHLYSLFAPENPEVDSIYRFNKIGCNWRAFLAYICGILPNIVGFVGATETHKVPIGATRVYDLNFFVGFISAFLVYAIACYVSPMEGVPNVGPFEKGWYEEEPDVENFEEELQGHVVIAGSEQDVTYTTGSSDSKKHYDD